MFTRRKYAFTVVVTACLTLLAANNAMAKTAEELTVALDTIWVAAHRRRWSSS